MTTPPKSKLALFLEQQHQQPPSPIPSAAKDLTNLSFGYIASFTVSPQKRISSLRQDVVVPPPPPPQQGGGRPIIPLKEEVVVHSKPVIISRVQALKSVFERREATTMRAAAVVDKENNQTNLSLKERLQRYEQALRKDVPMIAPSTAVQQANKKIMRTKQPTKFLFPHEDLRKTFTVVTELGRVARNEGNLELYEASETVNKVVGRLMLV